MIGESKKLGRNDTILHPCAILKKFGFHFINISNLLVGIGVETVANLGVKKITLVVK